jgi:hypothetical protein
MLEKLKEGVEEAPKDTKYIANFRIRLAKGLLNDSEYKSFVASIQRALAALDPETPMEISMEPRVFNETQGAIEARISEGLERQRALEQSLAAAGNGKPQLVVPE